MIESMGLPKLLVVAPWVANFKGWFRVRGRDKSRSALVSNAIGNYAGEHIIRNRGTHDRFSENQLHGRVCDLRYLIRGRPQGIARYFVRDFRTTLRQVIGKHLGSQDPIAHMARGRDLLR